MDYKGNGKTPISAGPWGGEGGTPWDDGVYSTIRQLEIVHGSAIDSIKIEYDKKGSSVWSERHGGNGGNKVDKVKLDYPDEVLVSISGYYGSFSFAGAVAVRSLTFETNKAKYGPFGTEQGSHFSFLMTGGKIVGFHGRSGWYLDCIGLYLKPLQELKPSKALVRSQGFPANAPTAQDGYNVFQGTVGKGYDVVFALREKEDQKNNTSRTYLSSDDESKSMVLGYPGYTAKGPSGVAGPVTCGPWGGNGGTIFDDGVYTGVRQINLTRNAGITSIKVLYDRNGQEMWGNKHGGGSGIRTDKIIFDYPYEVLTHITGYYGTTLKMGPTAIKCLTFHTTKRKYGPYGDEQGSFFSSSLGEGKIVGFHGRKGWYIDCIGVHVLEGKLSLPLPLDKGISEVESQWSNKIVLANKRRTEEEVAYGVVKEPVPFGPGPWGGEGGKPWDDGVFTGVKQIFLTRGEAMTSIQIEYDRNGQSIWSTKHGGGGGENTHKIRFEYPNEVLNCICGYYSSINRDEKHKVIRSLTFYTSRGKYGPYGEEIGTFFTSTTTPGKVVGFHGRSSLCLDAIGVHMQHWLGERKAPKSIISKIFN